MKKVLLLLSVLFVTINSYGQIKPQQLDNYEPANEMVHIVTDSMGFYQEVKLEYSCLNGTLNLVVTKLKDNAVLHTVNYPDVFCSASNEYTLQTTTNIINADSTAFTTNLVDQDNNVVSSVVTYDTNTNTNDKLSSVSQATVQLNDSVTQTTYTGVVQDIDGNTSNTITWTSNDTIPMSTVDTDQKFSSIASNTVALNDSVNQTTFTATITDIDGNTVNTITWVDNDTTFSDTVIDTDTRYGQPVATVTTSQDSIQITTYTQTITDIDGTVIGTNAWTDRDTTFSDTVVDTDTRYGQPVVTVSTSEDSIQITTYTQAITDIDGNNIGTNTWVDRDTTFSGTSGGVDELTFSPITYNVDSTQVTFSITDGDGIARTQTLDFPCPTLVFEDEDGRLVTTSDCERIVFDREIHVNNDGGNVAVNSIGISAMDSDNTNTGSVSNNHRAIVEASTGSTASSEYSSILSSDDSQATGQYSTAENSTGSTASGTRSSVENSNNSEASGDYSKVLNSNNSDATGNNAGSFNSQNSNNAGSFSVIRQGVSTDISGGFYNDAGGNQTKISSGLYQFQGSGLQNEIGVTRNVNFGFGGTGQNNEQSGNFGVILNGQNNFIGEENQGFIANGTNNTVLLPSASIINGSNNTIAFDPDGGTGIILGGDGGNIDQGVYNMIGLSRQSSYINTNFHGTILNGEADTVVADYATIINGANHHASSFSEIIMGRGGNVRFSGQNPTAYNSTDLQFTISSTQDPNLATYNIETKLKNGFTQIRSFADNSPPGTGIDDVDARPACEIEMTGRDGHSSATGAIRIAVGSSAQRPGTVGAPYYQSGDLDGMMRVNTDLGTNGGLEVYHAGAWRTVATW